MKDHKIFKQNLLFQKKIILQYNQEAEDFQRRHNLEHPGRHIWKHRRDLRTFLFYEYGSLIYVRVTIFRFRFAGTNRTFTFYGSLFSAFSRFARSFISQAAAQTDALISNLGTLFSEKTLLRWKDLLCVLPVPVASAGWDYAESS